jgi:hypothetical protein
MEKKELIFYLYLYTYLYLYLYLYFFLTCSFIFKIPHMSSIYPWTSDPYSRVVLKQLVSRRVRDPVPRYIYLHAHVSK